MLDINWEDVRDILINCAPYIIFFAVVAVLAIIAAIVISKKKVSVRKIVRTQSIVAVILALMIMVTGICMGPMYNIIALAMGNGTLSDETVRATEANCKDIAGEGTVLLKNESSLLPLANGSNLNVFGWASTNPCYGGTGSGAISDSYEKVTLLEGLENAGFNLNTELTDFYTAYRPDHPEISPFLQDWTLPEPPASTYPDALMDNAKAFSDTALIVISRTGAEAADLLPDMTLLESIWVGSSVRANDFHNNTDEYEEFPQGTHFLQLSQSEKDMVKLVCDNFANVIVIYNGSNAFELGFVNEYPSIKGALWCAGPGQNGFNALGEILSGVINPSGRTTDTFVTSLKNAPYINNIGKFTYTNMEEFAGDMRGDKTLPTFVNYVEGIYVGYRFYETAAEEGFLNYDEAVVYPFGYGLSYTTFTQEMGPISESNGAISFDVTVTNTGSKAGKEVVEVYYNPPYTNGGIEKAAANLIAFDKTDLLEPGKSQVITIEFNAEDMASFDTYGAGAYVLEAGSYEISINKDSHNKIDSQTYTVSSTVTYGESNPRSTDVTAATSKLADLRGGEYDDERWEKLLDQLTVDEMKEMIAIAGYSTAAASSVGKVATVDCDGPAAINNNFTGVGSLGFPSETMIANTWNADMAELSEYALYLEQ